MTDIPDLLVIMRNKGWTEGAALLRHWMEHPGNSDPACGVPDFTTVKVAWTLQYQRASDAYGEAIAAKVWTTADARRRLRAVIERRISDPRNKSSLLRVDMVRNTDPSSLNLTNVGDIYTDRVAYHAMASMTDIDALTAALGRFGYYFNVSGGCEPKNDGYEVHVDRVGIYIRDSYDFNDDRHWWDPSSWPSQHLGFWDSQQNYVGGANPVHCWDVTHTGNLAQAFGSPIPYGPDISIDIPQCSYATRITNSDFRDYRERTRMGGDFFVYSDIHYHETDDVFMV